MAKPYMCGDDAPIYVPSGGCDCNYTIRKIETLEYADSYALLLNGEQVGATINIPKDQVVQNGVVNTVVSENTPYDGALVGDKYIMLTIANSDAKIYIPMKEVMGGGYLVVDELPDIGDSQHIYLVPNGSGGYDRYIYSDDEWVNIGNTEVDLTNYYTKAEVDALVAGYIREDSNGDVAITRNLDLGGDLDVGDDIVAGGDVYANEHYCTTNPLELGQFYCGAMLTSESSTLVFSVPTGRVFPPGTTIDRITCEIEARASSSSGTGEYIMSSNTGGGYSGWVQFDSDTNCSFRAGGQTLRDMNPTMYSLSLSGGTNIVVGFRAGTSYYFSGTSAVNDQINNQAVSVRVQYFKVYFNIP